MSTFADRFTRPASTALSLVKRGYYGIYHRMTGKHLHRYVNEITSRAGIHSMDTMAQMEYTVNRMVGKTPTCSRLTA